METTAKTLAERAAEVDAYCQDKGWRETPVSFGEAMALLHTEIAEATEAWRKHGLADRTPRFGRSWAADGESYRKVLPKPEGVPSEFADIFIRVLDDSVLFGVDLDAEMDRHRGAYALNESFLENTNTLHTMVARASEFRSLGEDDYRRWFAVILTFLLQLCEHYGIDLDAEYARKMAYNKSRPYRHGDKRA